MRINQLLSNKIKIAGLICTMMVLYRHSLNYLAFFNSWTGVGISGKVEDFCSLLTEIAVPYFFIISGFFFFRISYTVDDYLWMIKKKFHSLFIPFVFWNVIGAGFLLFIDAGKIGDSLLSCITNLLRSDWYGPLWYVRDLMILMLLYPVYGWLFRINNGILYSVCILISFYYWIPVDSSILSTESILFFLIGGVLSNCPKAFEYRLPLWSLCLLAFVWFGTCAHIIPILSVYMHRMNILIGVVVFWQLLNFLGERVRCCIIPLTEYSFLLYVMHAYPMKAIKRLAGAVFYGNDVAALLTYLFLPLLVAVLIYYVGRVCKRLFPHAFSIVLGGRS